jgi:hypothetical protein
MGPGTYLLGPTLAAIPPPSDDPTMAQRLVAGLLARAERSYRAYLEPKLPSDRGVREPSITSNEPRWAGGHPVWNHRDHGKKVQWPSTVQNWYSPLGSGLT